MTKKLLFRHNNTTQFLTGFARRVVILFAVLCSVGGAWGQVENISTGAIDDASKIAEYNDIKTNYPVNASAFIPAIADWYGEMRENSAGQHWNGIDPSSYWEQTVGTWGSDNWNQSKSITVHLPEGEYVLMGACRSSVNADAYISVNGTQVLTPKGNTGLGITTDGRPSFDANDTYANGTEGWGWQYRYIKFEVTAGGGADVTIAIGGGTSTAINQWMSFTQPQLFTKSTTSNGSIAGRVPIDMGAAYTFKLYDQVNGNDVYLNLTDDNAIISNTPQSLYLLKASGDNRYFLSNGIHYVGIDDIYLKLTATNRYAATLDEMSWVEIDGAHPYTGYCSISYWGGDNYVGCGDDYGVCTVDKSQSGAGKGLWEIKKRYTLTDLTQAMFQTWTGYDDSATPSGTTGCAYGFGISTGDVYGDMSVYGNHYADLSKYGKLELTVMDGTPRLLFNRQSNDDSGEYIEITDDSKPYVTHNGNKWTIDLKAMVSQEGGYAHLNCIKGANWAPVTITSAILTLPVDDIVIPSTDLRPNEVTHKKSYLYQYAEDYAEWELELQGLASDAESDWWDHDNKTQRVNQFEITHYLKEGEDDTFQLPTAQDTNDHTMYQRWYNYDDEEDIESILSHVTLNGRTVDNEVRSVDYYLYKNGLVTGDGIDKTRFDSNKTPYAYTDFKYTNTNGRSMTVAADVSRYSDMTYANPTSPLEDNLEEPTLTMRYIYYMKDAREMATKLTQKTVGNTLEEPWLEEKTFHFPSRSLAYENDKRAGYQGEFLGLRHIFSDYWIFDGQVDENTTFEQLNEHLISSSNNIVVEISDPNSTEIRLGGCKRDNPQWGGGVVPQAGDVIRGYFSNAQNGFEMAFKHGGTYTNWEAFPISITNWGGGNGYFETTIPNNSSIIDEILFSGFSIQGHGFTLGHFEIIRNNANLGTIYDTNNYAFDNNWSGRLATIPAPLKYTIDGDGDYMGFYLQDLMHPWTPYASYGDSRFLVFRYPDGGRIPQSATNKPVYLRAYFVDPTDNSKRYQLAQFTIIFDRDDESGEEYATLPWKSVNGSAYVQGSERDPNQLRAKAGKPIAKITFDYPAGTTYHFPVGAATNHGQNRHEGESYNYDNNQPYLYPDADHPSFDGTIPDSSPIPLIFDKSNYAFDGENSLFGAYALLTNMNTRWGNKKNCLPANHGTQDANGNIQEGSLGYAIGADPGYQSGFLYIDASELPGDICSAPFVGDFCPGDHLMVSGWISGANNVENGTDQSGIRSPGGITLTLKGEHMVDGELKTETLYRFCPGMCYELDDGGGVDGNDGGTNVVWQQFYFDFKVNEKYDRHWIEVNNNCVSSQGGDFMLDNIEVFAIVPEVIPNVNTPLCISLDESGNTVTEMRFLKLSLNHNKMISSVDRNTIGTSDPEVGFVVLEKNVFLEKLREGLSGLSETQKHTYHLDDYDFSTITLDELEYARFEGKLETAIHNIPSIYQDAFDEAFVGDRKIWRANNPTQNMNGGIMYFEWKPNFEDMPLYSFTDAVTKKYAVFREEIDGEKFIVMNGNYPELPWKTNVDYYIVPSNAGVTTINDVYGDFNICTACNKAGEFRIEPPLTVLGLEKTEDTNDYVVCEGQIPTLVTELKGYDFYGNEVPMQDINYDWWLGDKDYEDPSTHEKTKLATLTNYHSQEKNGIRLDRALSTLRIYYPDATDIDGIIGHVAVTPNPALTLEMVNYLKELVDAGQLVLHQKSISVPAEPASADDPYFYLVACPIHDDQFKRTLYHEGSASLINNGTMEGPDEASFYMGDPTTNGIKIPATITLGVGNDDSKGICISTTSDGNSSPWDTQFFIRANEVIPLGSKLHLEFDYKATSAASVHTQFHAAPGTCIYYNGDGNLNFTTEWQRYNKDIEVTSTIASANNFQSIAFDLWTTGSPNDYYFDNVVMTVDKKQYVAFFCDEPQGLRVKVGEKAPTLKTGFVPGENTFDSYDYSDVNNAVLSIRLAKKEQFETVKHGDPNDPAISDPAAADANLHFLWLPIRDAMTQEGAKHVIRKSQDDNIYLASTNDPVNDKTISASMKKGSLPIVGKIVQLQAINTAGSSNLNKQIDENRLCIYFTENFEVREGYSYTLTLPFQEEGDVNTCDGNILINLKIVPDYEVWTGGAGNTDWNNDENWRRADGNLTAPIAESQDESKRNNNELYRTNNLPDESPLKEYVTNYTNYRTPMDRILRKGFAPLYCTHVLIKSNEWGDAPVLYDAIDNHEIIAETGSKLINLPFPNLRDTSTPILKFDMQARHYDLWEETYGEASNKGRTGDLIAEMYQINSCDEIAMQPGTELRNAYLLNYNSAWMEFQLNTKRWYLLGSPLQGTISGEWYAPTGNSPQQKTTYYEPVTFGDGYDRYSPAIYQRSWDKAKAVLYEVGSAYSTGDDDQTENLGTEDQGEWLAGATQGNEWQMPNNGTADDYLDRLGYKPFGANKANVAIKGIWSNTYNDAQVDYATGGFSVMVMNHLKGNDADVEAIIRLPKEDTFYDYYGFDRQGSDNVNQYEDIGTNTQLSDVRGKGRALNRGRLKADLLLPEIEDGNDNKIIQKTEKTASRYGDQRTYTRIPIKEADLTAMNDGTFSFTEKVAAGESDLGYYLVENPFPCGLDMAKFFAANSVTFTQEEIDNATDPEDPAYGKTTNDVKEGLERKYWLLTKAGDGQNPRQVLVQQAPAGEWITSDGTNFGSAIEYPDPSDNTQTLEFYPNAVVAPGQGFFVQAKTGFSGELTVTFNKDMQAQTRFGVKDNENGTPFTIVVGQTQVTKKMYDADGDGTPETELPAADAAIYQAGDTYTVGNEEKVVYEVPVYKTDGQNNYILDENDNKIPELRDIPADVVIYNYKQATLKRADQTTVDKAYPLLARTRGESANLAGLVITAERDGNQTSALVMQREEASDDFLPTEDTEVFITSDFENVPTVYTLCGRLATTINSIHEFRSLPLGVESSSDAPCVLTFQGVEALGDSVAFYDAVEQTLTPLKSGMQVSVSGQTQNRYYLVRSLIKKEAAEETHIQIFTEGLTAKVIASTAEPIVSVRCFDTAGRLIHSASPQSQEYSFTLPISGVYIIEAETENDRKTKKLLAR